MQDRLTILFQLHFSKTSTAQQEAEFLDMVNSGKYEDQLTQLFVTLYEQGVTNELDPANYYNPGARERMLKNIFGIEAAQNPQIKPSIWKHTGFRILVAAAIATIIFGAVLFFYKSEKVTDQTTISYAQDVAPGKQGATLTTANGTKIRLSDVANGKLAEETGVKITKTKDGQLVYEVTGKGNENQINTISTSNGETYIVQLPDGSKAWLNSASSLTYSASLVKNGKRSVTLTGEGYFEVAKNKALPFMVATGSQEIEVLGTHFNINAYQNEPAVATTLIEGSVKVTANGNSKLIAPGEQATSNTGEIKVQKVNLDNIIDWKDGDFNLNNLPFEVAMRKISRWYDVEVIYDPSAPTKFETGGWLTRDKQLSFVLQSIESLGIVHFKIEGRKVYVTP